MQGKLAGKRVAILATDGFEQSELLDPLMALRRAGAEVRVVSLDPGQIQGMKHADKGDKVPVDLVIEEARETDFSGLVLPGGVANPDRQGAAPRPHRGDAGAQGPLGRSEAEDPA
jgi:protease I